MGQAVKCSGSGWPTPSRPPKLPLIHLMKWSIKHLNTVLLEIAKMTCLVIQSCQPRLVQPPTGLDEVRPLCVGELADNPTFPRTDIRLRRRSYMAHDVDNASELPLTPCFTNHGRAMADIIRGKQKVATPQTRNDACPLCDLSRLLIWLAVWLPVMDSRNSLPTTDRL